MRLLSELLKTCFCNSDRQGKPHIHHLVIVSLVIGLGLLANAVASESAGSIPKLLSPESIKSVSEWFTPERKALTDIPESIKKLISVEKDQVEAVRGELWKAYAGSPLGQELKKSLPDPLILEGKADPTQQLHELKTGEKIMPYYFVGKGDLQGQRALFIALHGGGSAGGSAPSPHGWEVNTREWNTQARLAAGVYPADSLYFVPRMADDNDGRWYYNYCQDAYDRVVRAAILHHNVNPNRVYLIGISEGAYTAYRLGAFMADRWAGAGSMAGGEPLSNAPPENMRNIAFRADVGEKDTMFDRVGLNQRYGQALVKLQKDDPNGFVHTINVQAGRGHGIDYKPCPQWIYQYLRNPRPKRVMWTVIKVHDRLKGQFYWLAMDDDPGALPIYIDARVDRQSQTVELTVEKDGQDDKHEPTNEVALRVYLDDEMLNLDEPVRIVRNGKQVFKGIVPRRGDVMMRSLAERGDPCYIFPGVIAIPRGSGAEESNEQKLMKLFPENLSAQALMRADKEQRRPLAAILNKAGDNRNELLEMLRSVKDEHVKAAVFLVMNMPDCDIVSLKKDFLVEQIELAYDAWEKSPWHKEIPEQLFLQYILPYAHLNEHRDNWRRNFMERLREKAWSYKSPIEATIWLNNELNDIFKVYFHATKRPKADQSPYESIEAGYASCTGLSLLLADSCRSVGIPARLVGVPQWTEVPGNHNWVEVWDGQWHNVGGTGSDPRDDDWVDQRCQTQTDPDQWLHTVYAACFRQTSLRFPLVWDMDIDYVPALNVTRFYSARKVVEIEIPDSGSGIVEVYWAGEIVARAAGQKSVSFTLASGNQYQAQITTPDGQVHRKTLRL